MAMTSDISGISTPSIFIVSFIIFFLLTKTILWIDRKLDEIVNLLENELIEKMVRRKLIKKKKKLSRNDNKIADCWDSDFFKIIWPGLKRNYPYPLALESKSDENQKQTYKRLELMNKKKSSQELLNLEIEISKILKKHKRPNRFYLMACKIQSDVNFSKNYTDAKICEFRKEGENNQSQLEYNIRRSNNPMGDACSVIRDLKNDAKTNLETEREYYQSKDNNLIPKRNRLESVDDYLLPFQTKIKNNCKVCNVASKTSKKEGNESLCKTRSLNSHVRSNSKIMNIIRIFTIGKLFQKYNNRYRNDKKRSKFLRLKYNRSNTFNIIYTVKKYSSLFTEQEKNNFLKSIVTPRTMKKLYNSCPTDTQKNKCKVPLDLGPSTNKLNLNFNKKNYERLQRLINFRMKLNACLEYYYKIRSVKSENLMKMWDILRNVKFNLFDKKSLSEISFDKEILNSKMKKPFPYNNICRKEKLAISKILSASKIKNSQSFIELRSSFSNCSITSLQCSARISNESIRKFVRTNKIRKIEERINNRNKIPTNNTDLLKNKTYAIPRIKNISDLPNQINRTGFFYNNKEENTRNNKDYETIFVNKMYTPKFMRMYSDNCIKHNETNINSFISSTDFNETGKVPAGKKLPTLTAIKIKKSVESKIADLQQRIKKSKAIVNPIKSTITNFVIPTNKIKISECKNEVNSINQRCTVLKKTYSSEKGEYIEQIYKNPNFSVKTNKEKRYPNFIERNKQFVKEFSKRRQEKLKINNKELKNEIGTNENMKINLKERSFIKSQRTHKNNFFDTNGIETIFINTRNKSNQKDCNNLKKWKEEQQIDTKKDQSESEEEDLYTHNKGKRLRLSPSYSNIFFKGTNDRKHKEFGVFEQFDVNENCDKNKIKNENPLYGKGCGDYMIDSSNEGKVNSIRSGISDYRNEQNKKKLRENKIRQSKDMKRVYENQYTIKNYFMCSEEEPSDKNNSEFVNEKDDRTEVIGDNKNVNETDIETLLQKVERCKRHTYDETPVINTKLKYVNENSDEGKQFADKVTPKEIDTDLIIKKITESCKRFQQMRDSEITSIQNMIFERKVYSDNRPTKVDFVECKRTQLPTELTRQSKNENENWRSKINNDLKDDRENLANRNAKYSDQSDEMRGNDVTCRSMLSKEQWPHNITNQSKNLKQKWEIELNSQSSGTKVKHLNDYYGGNDLNIFGRSPSSESCRSNNSIDSQRALRIDYDKSISEWLIPEVFNVNSNEYVVNYTKRSIDNKIKEKRNKKTRLQEYLKRFKCETEQGLKLQNPKSNNKISIFPPLLE